MHVKEEPEPARILHVKDEPLMDSSFPDVKEEVCQYISYMEEMTSDKVVKLFYTMARGGGLIPTYKQFNSEPFRESLNMPDRIWNKLEPAIKEKIHKIRANLRRKDKE